MAADYTDLLALMGDVLRAVDRQTEENKKAVDHLGNRVDRLATIVEQTGDRFEAIFNRFAEATSDGFSRIEKKVDGVKQEVAELRTDVRHINQRLARVEQNQATQADMLRRLEVPESMVLRKAS